MHVTLAILLDSIFGDPKGLPHPVMLIGRVIKFWEARLYSRGGGRQRGAVFCAAVLLSVGCAVSLLLWLAGVMAPFVHSAVEIYLLYSAIAYRSLRVESGYVADSLAAGDVAEARRYLSYIVGRDTEGLGVADIVRASVETIGENYIDGVVSVLFWMWLGLFAGHAALFAWLFKAASTMDSMVGYKNEHYRDFGMCAAKLDDALNFIPARLGGLIAIFAGRLAGFDWRRGLRVFKRDRLKHNSPNSAHGESAFAGLLGIRLGGGAFYGGVFEGRPTLGDDIKPPETRDIYRAHKILTYSTLICAFAIAVTEVIL